MPFCCICHHAKPQLHYKRLRGLRSSTKCMHQAAQGAHNLCIAGEPQHLTTLARFTALRWLSLLNAERLGPDEVC